MRKSFTRFLSVLMLFCAFGLQVFAAVDPWDGTKSVPVDEYANVNPASIATQFELAFSDTPAVTAAGGTLVVYEGTSTIVKLIPISQGSSNVSVVGTKLIVKHGIASFKEETNYHITLTSGAITVGGISFGGISGTTWSFTTGDFTAPKLASVTPLVPKAGATNVEANLLGASFSLVMKFNEAVLPGKGNIAVYQENGTVVELIDAADLSEGDFSGATVTIPVAAAAHFLPQTKYYVRVAPGAFTDDVSAYGPDAVANDYAGITGNTAWTFTTRDTSAPDVTATVTNVTATTAKLNVKLSEAGSFKWYIGTEDPTDLTGFTEVTGVAANTTKVISVPATGTFTGGTTYYAYVVASNTEVPPSTTSLENAIANKVEFTTVDNTGPVVQADIPEGTTGRGQIVTDKKTTGVYIIFDEQVKGGTGSLVVRKAVTNEAIFTLSPSAVTSVQIPATAEEYAGKWKTTLNFGGALASNENYYIVFPEGYITDMLGNKYISSNNPNYKVPVNYTGVDAWLITSSDFEAPVVSFSTTTVTTATAGNITGAGNGDDITIKFDEDVLLADGSSWPTDFAGWSKYVAFQKDGIAVPATYTASADAITIHPTDGLTSNTTYTVILRPGVIMDASVNNNVLAAGKTITVTIGDNETPTFSFGPETELGVYTPLTITFDKDVFVKSSATVKAALASSNLAALIAVDNGGTAVTDDKFTMVYDATTKTITVTPKTGNAYATSVCADESPVVYHLVLTTTNLVDSKFGSFTPTNAASTTATTATGNYNVSDYQAPTATLIASPLTESAINTAKLTITYDEVVGLLPSYVSGENLVSQIILKKNSASGENIPFTAAFDGTNKVITITPVADGGVWAPGTYYYGIGASMEDCAHNVAVADYKTFTVTANPVPTTLKALSYTINGGASYAIDAKAEGVTPKSNALSIVITFDQAIDDANLGAAYQPVVSPSLAYTAITSSSVNGNKLTINFPATVSLASKTEYAITIPTGLVEGNATYDAAGSLYAQLPTDGVTFSFISKDTDAPVVTATTPADGATSVPVNFGEAGFTLTFNEKVVLGTGSITLTAAGATAAEQTITVNSSNVTLALDETETFTIATVKVADLKLYNTHYTVAIGAGTFKDLAGNAIATTGLSTGFTFDSELNTKPVVAEDGLYPANGSDLVPYSLDLTMKFSEPVEQASVAGSRKLVYVYKVSTTAGTHASINTTTGDIIPGTAGDTQVYYGYVDIAASVGVSNDLVTIKGVTLAANNEYYVLITPGAFKDKVLPTSEVLPYDGITEYGTWHFFTGDVVPAVATLDFTKFGLDELVATDSDIKIVFSKAISKADGTAITNVEIPTLITLAKGATNIAFTGTISTDKKTITISNSSLVHLGELKGSTEYTVAFAAGTFKSTASGDVLGSWSKTFETSDYTAPDKPGIAFTTNEAESVYVDTDSKAHTAELTLSDLSEGDAVKLYYFWTSDLTTTLTAAQVKGIGTAVDVADAPAALVFNTNMVNETEYKVLAVAEDAAGNLSAVTDFTYTTDDVVAPELAGALPTSLGADNNLTLVFNEDVEPAEGFPYARVIDSNGVTYQAPITKISDTEADGYAISVLIDALDLPISEDVATYTVEIDPGMIVDVPRLTGDEVNANEPNAFAGILGASFKVSSTDKVAPQLDPINPLDPENGAVVGLTPSFKLNFTEAVKLNDTFTQFVVYEEGDDTNPYDVVSVNNVTGQGTSTITLTTNRALVSGNHYTLVVNNGTFSDLSGNAWANEGDVIIGFTATDTVGLPVTFRLPQDGEPFYLPVTEPLTEVPQNVCIVFADNNGKSGWDGDAFNYQAYRVNANDPLVNSYDLASHLYLKVDGVDVPFTFTTTWGNDRINLFADFEAYKGKTITYGFTNLYDVNGLLNSGAEVSFSIAADAVVDRLVTFTPGDNETDSETDASHKVNITVDQTFKVEFKGIIYSYNADNDLNNLIMTPALLKSLGVFSLSPMPIDATLDIVSYSEAGGNSVVTLKVSEPLDSETDYTLHLNDHGVIQIGQGHSPLGSYHEFFTTADVTAPKLIAGEDGKTLPAAYLPNNGGTIAKTATLALVFDEPVVGAGTVEIHRWDGVQVASVNIAGVESDEDNVINISALTDLPTNTKYYVIVPAGAITDKATIPNAFAGITKVNEWSFDLRDDAYPAVSLVQNLKTNVSVSTPLQLLFDRPVDAISEGYGWLAIYEEADGDAVKLIRIPPSAEASNVTSYEFNLEMDLKPFTKYYVELGEGTFVLHADGTTPQKQVNIGDWYFTTGSNTAPVPVTYSPDKTDPMTTQVALTSGLSITFDQDVVAGIGNIQLHQKQATGGPIITNFDVTDATKVSFVGNTLSISSAVLGLKENSEYYVIIPANAVKNTAVASPKYWAGITVPFVWQFSTVVDGTAPKFVSGTPTGTMVEGNHPTFVLTFDESVLLGTGNLKVYKKDGTTPVLTVPVTGATVSDKTVTVTYVYDATVGGLDKNTDYYVLVDAGVVKDAAGNAAVALTDVTKWTFKTGADFATPVVEPKDNSLEFKVYPNPFVDFVTVTNASELSKVVISNIAGQIVKEVVRPDDTIQLNELRSGIYFITLYQEDAVIKTVKIAKR